jgi:hypothetical protein
MDEQPEQSGWGCGFSFRDPEGNVWDVAFKHGSDFDHLGQLSRHRDSNGAVSEGFPAPESFTNIATET